jgi:hypothetical protein
MHVVQVNYANRKKFLRFHHHNATQYEKRKLHLCIHFSEAQLTTKLRRDETHFNIAIRFRYLANSSISKQVSWGFRLIVFSNDIINRFVRLRIIRWNVNNGQFLHDELDV